MTTKSVNRIDQFMLMHSARADQWRDVSIHAEEWADGRTGRTALEDAVEALAPIESFHAFPGPVSFAILRDRIAANDAAGALKLSRRISNALLTRSYHEHPGEMDLSEDGAGDVADVLPPAIGERRAHRPYLRGDVRQQPAVGAVASAGRRTASPAPPGGRVRLRTRVRRLVRGCVLRRRDQPGVRGGGHRRGFSVQISL